MNQSALSNTKNKKSNRGTNENSGKRRDDVRMSDRFKRSDDNIQGFAEKIDD